MMDYGSMRYKEEVTMTDPSAVICDYGVAVDFHHPLLDPCYGCNTDFTCGEAVCVPWGISGGGN